MSLQGSLSIERMCELTRVSRASFYRSFREKHPVEEEMEVRSAIQQIAVEHRRRYGYRRIAAELRRRGMPVNHKRVMRIMGEDNLLAVRMRAFVVTTNSHHEFEVHLNLAGRMKLTGINQLWVADITYIRLKWEFVYLAVILDAFSRKVVGWELGKTLAVRLALAALNKALVERKPGPGLGAPFRSRAAVRVQRVCKRAQGAPDDPQHESAGESIRQCELRELHENLETRRNLRKPIRRPWAHACEHRRIHRAVLQSAAAALGIGLPSSGRIRTAN